MSASREETHDGVATVSAGLRDRGGPGTPLLSVRGLIKHFGRKAGVLTKAGALVRAVDGVDFDVAKGETLGIVGESGCGKSVTALSLMRLIPQPPGKIVKGSIIFDGQDILKMDDDDVRGIRGNNTIGATTDTQYAGRPVDLASGAPNDAGHLVRPADIHATVLQAMGLSYDHIENQQPKIVEAMLA